MPHPGLLLSSTISLPQLLFESQAILEQESETVLLLLGVAALVVIGLDGLLMIGGLLLLAGVLFVCLWIAGRRLR